MYAFKDVLLECIKLSLKSKIKSLIYKTSLMHLPITVANMESMNPVEILGTRVLQSNALKDILSH